MPESSSRLSYKFQRLRESIREAIREGDLGHKLPGERELARRFGVNAKTISKALTDLTSEGLLVRQVGRGTFVANRSGEPVHQSARYLWLAPTGALTAQADVLRMATDRLRTRGHRLDVEEVDPDADGALPDRCLAISQLRDIAGVLVFGSTPSVPLLSDLARRHIPAVLCHTMNPAVKTNQVSADATRGAYELTEHLVLLGHRSIQLLHDAASATLLKDFRRGYLTALTRYAIDAPSESNLDGGGTVDPTATAVVICGGQAARRLRQAGLREIPGQLSAAVMPEPGEDAADLTAYEVFPDQLVDWAVQLLADATPGAMPRQVIVPGILRDRQSTARVPGTAVNRPQHAVL